MRAVRLSRDIQPRAKGEFPGPRKAEKKKKIIIVIIIHNNASRLFRVGSASPVNRCDAGPRVRTQKSPNHQLVKPEIMIQMSLATLI